MQSGEHEVENAVALGEQPGFERHVLDHRTTIKPDKPRAPQFRLGAVFEARRPFARNQSLQPVCIVNGSP